MDFEFSSEETIAAIATAVAVGKGGIAIIRISGPSAKAIAREIIITPSNKAWESHQVLYGYVMDQGANKRIDEVLTIFMKGPKSFTGEDVVEIHCHGGVIAVDQVLERILANSKVRRALPGEFSQRAVLNNRISLTQAEAISDLVAARSRKAAQIAMFGLEGMTQKRMLKLRETLLDQLSEIEARVDFEDEMPPLNGEQLLKNILNIQENLVSLINDSNQAECYKNGFKVGIVGRPNVGKSSLLNRLCKYDRAIVNHVPGTTRDSLESEVILKGIPINLIDTAGIRNTDNEVEKLGIERSHQVMMTADLAILIFDLNIGWTKDDSAIFREIPTDIPRLLIGNKCDISKKKADLNLIIDHKAIKLDVIFSAITGEGESDLIDRLIEKCGASQQENLQIVFNQRQKDLALKASESLGRIQQVALEKLPWDFWTIDLREAIHYLGEITGEEITEAVLDRIFSRFCIGK